MPEESADRVHLLMQASVVVDPVEKPFPRGLAGFFRVGRDRLPGQLRYQLALTVPVDVLALEVQGHGRVQGMAADDNVGRPAGRWECRPAECAS